MTANTNKYAELTKEVIKALDTPKVWESGLSGIASSMPVNSKGNYYSGINIILLWIAAEQKGFAANKWMTYKQAKEQNANVKKGERGTKIIFFKKWEKENKEGEKETIPVMRVYTVFNIEQIEGLKIETVEQFETWEAIEHGENLLSSSECKIQTANVTPCYMPSKDLIKLPAKTNFNTAENFYTTLAHEMVHSTMHKSRLDRKAEKNKEGYAFEELIAELGAVFTCAKLGIKGDIENHASYLKSWLKAMQNDVKYIFKAATAASKASDYLLDNLEK